eukprot:14256687-Ditylum_brightwellii.AAC.1
MEILADKIGTSQRNILPPEVWTQVKTELDDTYGGKGYVDHQKHYITERVCPTCAKLNNSDVIRTVEETAIMTYMKRPFMQFN